MTHQNLLVELFVEELPPKALKKLGEVFASQLCAQLRQLGLASSDSVSTPFASPRRLAAHITHVAAKAADTAVQQKLMPVSVGLDADGLATPALLKKLQALGADVSDPVFAVAALRKAPDGKAEALFYDSQVTGATLDVGLQHALLAALAQLPIPKMMSYQLETDCELPGWSSVNFVRPAHGLLALHGSTVVPVKVLGLSSGQQTQGHRFEAHKSPVQVDHADDYAATLLRDGAVIASFGDRRFAIVQQLAQAAERLGPGFEVLMDDALLDEVTALVERPNVLTCQFEAQFLAVPQECLILTMKANQKYFPLVDTQGKLTNQFLVVSNISPLDASAVIGGNERVVRPRLSDAKFFFDQDRKKTLESRVAGLDKVVYHNKLGTQGERMVRVCAIAQALALQVGGEALGERATQAARLAKTDLLTDMVGEFPELQGIMGGYYARHDGLTADVAEAIEDHYKPRFAGDALPRNPVGVVVALADKLETLVGMFGIGNLPTGDKDPFALRRHALGVIRMLVEKDLALDLKALLASAVPAFGDKITDASAALGDFIYDRLAGSLREQGYSALEVDAVLALRPQRLGDVPRRLAAVRAFTALAEAPALAAANKRISNILKKADAAGAVDAHVSELLLQEPAEKALYAAMQDIAPRAQALFVAGDYTTALQTLAALRAPVDAFFDGVMVNAEALDLRLNRLGLLKTLHGAMNQVADLSRLAA
ncbi:glycine--tRNA ligase subunit beta [Rhodoferax sp.]|uniref:glycine--tRNA ligase subunit beta n=1 Tax=Rhodoferax sp. TaxID=50421 RepID=UPI00272FDF27|nr:glycine--tRNA ligase subunit beta [Rhodoferax sp.]MDP1528280.1 glycine--tRNA ligase subunit beta [Rhodoferax sp.]MDP1944989.1 glycine--tRNA ligase subunit beta [Rhodoferax sp.]MDP2443030.1 glycine--tRNA ligase subunit beta [Rhodoferax sp.]MDZ4206555.1 glycine--tRNA ligase subunit beta [Rhodoferax sp.]